MVRDDDARGALLVKCKVPLNCSPALRTLLLLILTAVAPRWIIKWAARQAWAEQDRKRSAGVKAVASVSWLTFAKLCLVLFAEVPVWACAWLLRSQRASAVAEGEQTPQWARSG